ncbi:DUF1178 family protein [Erythrobacter litoralis]|uniref:DUF1178 family protein n=1 Tax=Erythrobacter litoralis TaxID=39960 RepID=UPI002434EB6B|nr:DUF1178 family protein [Erythrobacter litoralis]MDG6078214.1 DUF1178 family protein [Erythrobacter litoralis]
MIVFDLVCPDDHRFEGWFSSSADFTEQGDRGLLTCPVCGAADIRKAPMAPAVSTRVSERQGTTDSARGKQVANIELPAELKDAFAKIAKVQAEALKKSTWVGKKFAEEVRSQHYGEKDEAPVHGKATKEEAASLAEEGIAIAPILFPMADPDELN